MAWATEEEKNEHWRENHSLAHRVIKPVDCEQLYRDRSRMFKILGMVNAQAWTFNHELRKITELTDRLYTSPLDRKEIL